MMKDSNDGRLVMYLLTKPWPNLWSDLSCRRRGKSVMIQDRSDTIAIRAGTEEERDGLVYFLVLVTVFFLLFSFMYARHFTQDE